MKIIPNNLKIKLPILIIAYSLAALFIISLVRYPGIVNNVAGVISATEFECYTPYQYRALVPLIIRFAEAVTPLSIQDYINNRLGGMLDSKFRDDHPDLPGFKVDRLSKFGFRIFVYLGFTYFCLVLYLFLLRQLSIELKLFSDTTSALLPFGMIFIMPTYFVWTLMYYDYSHLMLFTLGLYLMYKRKWLPFMIVYALGCINKETMFFLPIIFAFYFYSKLSKSDFIKLLSLQVVITAVVKGALCLAFMDNTGGVAIFTLERNLNRMSSIATYFDFEVIGKGMLMPYYLNIPLPRGLNIPMFAALIYLVFYGWRRKPEFLRKATYYFPLLVIMALFWGFVDEFRAYYDFLPTVYFLSILGIKYFIEDRRKSEGGIGNAG